MHVAYDLTIVSPCPSPLQIIYTYTFQWKNVWNSIVFQEINIVKNVIIYHQENRIDQWIEYRQRRDIAQWGKACKLERYSPTWTPSGKQASVHRVMTFVQSSRTGKTTKTHIVQRCLQIKVKMTKHKTQGHDLWEGGRKGRRTEIWKGAGNCLLGTWTLTVLFISHLLTISMFMIIAD